MKGANLESFYGLVNKITCILFVYNLFGGIITVTYDQSFEMSRVGRKNVSLA